MSRKPPQMTKHQKFYPSLKSDMRKIFLQKAKLLVFRESHTRCGIWTRKWGLKYSWASWHCQDFFFCCQEKQLWELLFFEHTLIILLQFKRAPVLNHTKNVVAAQGFVFKRQLSTLCNMHDYNLNQNKDLRIFFCCFDMKSLSFQNM